MHSKWKVKSIRVTLHQGKSIFEFSTPGCIFVCLATLLPDAIKQDKRPQIESVTNVNSQLAQKAIPSAHFHGYNVTPLVTQCVSSQK